MLSHCYLICAFCFFLRSDYSFYVFNIRFMAVFFHLYILLSILCFLCFFIVSCIVSPHVDLSRCLFSIYVQVY
jgi:hypothetical protein